MRLSGQDIPSFQESRSTLLSIRKYEYFRELIPEFDYDIMVFLFLPLFSQASSFGWFWSSYQASIGDAFRYYAFHLCINYWFVSFRYNLLRKKFPAMPFTGSPVLSEAGFNLLNRLLTYDPEEVSFPSRLALFGYVGSWYSHLNKYTVFYTENYCSRCSESWVVSWSSSSQIEGVHAYVSCSTCSRQVSWSL